jgi:hypothetical protein
VPAKSLRPLHFFIDEGVAQCPQTKISNSACRAQTLQMTAPSTKYASRRETLHSEHCLLASTCSPDALNDTTRAAEQARHIRQNPGATHNVRTLPSSAILAPKPSAGNRFAQRPQGQSKPLAFRRVFVESQELANCSYSVWASSKV